MREILFRGKSVNDGNWVQGSLVITTIEPADDAPIKHYHIEDMTIGVFPNEYQSGLTETVDPETVGQFTGLTDKNGKKIFEGDICRFREWSKGEMCWVGKVRWEHQQFMITGGPNKECETMFELCMSRFVPKSIEVIGNIHDNPELLEGGAVDGK